jgi:hypothetical protein
MRKTLSSLCLSAAMIISSAVPALAQQINLKPTDQGAFFTGLYGLTIQGMISGAVKLVMIVAALVFFFLLIVGGIQWMTSGGDKAATESARGRITAALIGLVIVFSAWAIATLLQALFGVDIFNLVIPSLQGS